MLDHDTETYTEHAQFRQYNSTPGRWMSPDPYAGSYDSGNPQSFNRYAYVGANPLAMGDPSGLDGEDNCFASDVTITCSLSVGSKIASAVLDTENLDDFLTSIPLVGSFLDNVPIGTLTGSGELFYGFGQSFGWWGGSPFHGNVDASQSGKNVPASGAANVPGPSGFDPTDPGYQLAVALGQDGAYTINDPRFVAGFYGASLAGAGAVLAAPAAGGALRQRK